MADKKLQDLQAAVNVTGIDLLYGTQSDKSRKFTVAQVRGELPFVTVLDFGAKGDGATDDSAAFQAAIDSGKRVFVPRSLSYYKISTPLEIKQDAVSLIGEGIYQSDIRFYGASGSLLFNPNYSSTGYQRLYIEGLRLWSGLGGSTDPILDLRCLKFATVKNCWIHGNNANWPGTCVRLSGYYNGSNWIDGTYAHIEGNHFQLCGVGIDIQENANSSLTMRNRSQPSGLPGVGYRYGSAFAFYPNHITSIDDSCEYPGKVKTGFELNANANNITIISPRCESLLYGVRSTDATVVGTVIGGYYSGSQLTGGKPNNVVNDGGLLNDLSNSHNSANCKMQASFDGTLGGTIVPNRAMNVDTVVKNATGDYIITCKGTLVANPIVTGVALNANLQIKSIGTNSITVSTVDNTGTAIDSGLITIQVS